MKALRDAKTLEDGPYIYTGSQREKFNDGDTRQGPENEIQGTFVRTIQIDMETNVSLESPSCIVTIYNGKVYLDVTGRCDDSREASIVSETIEEKYVLRGIGSIKHTT